ncbi:MAG: hypothetical protein H6842_10410 [Rhodospirillaceae bacterium]|nr:hypothetical protein [Rhodospirillaceae bacterium]
MTKSRFHLAAVLLAAAACSYDAHIPSRPATDIYSSYAAPIPGKFALFVDGDEMRRTINPSGSRCSAHDYPVDGRSAFRTAVLGTIERVVESVEVVDSPLTRDELAAHGIAGMIRVEAEEMDAYLVVVGGSWWSDFEVELWIEASLVVEGREGRVFGTTVRVDQDGTAPGGGACGGGAEAISQAASRAMEELLEKLAERLSNSTEVRELNAGASDDGART